MPVTKEQALTANEFHYSPACNENRTERWRRNGQTKTWKLKQYLHRFRVPVKYGLYSYGYVDEDNAHDFHTAEDCPHGH